MLFKTHSNNPDGLSEKSIPPSINIEDKFAPELLKIAAASIISAVVVVAVYILKFRENKVSNDPSNWGAFGDYFGGLVNPIVGLTTVILIIYSIGVQRRELRASIEEMRIANLAATKMSFEQSLFSWLGAYQSLLASVQINEYKARHALKFIYDYDLDEQSTLYSIDSELKGVGLKVDPYYPKKTYEKVRLLPDWDGFIEIALSRAIKNYESAFCKYRSDLDAPIRTLYRLFRWIDESDLAVDEKWHYCSLVRAQLSWVELILLFYNGLIEEGRSFVVYANKYALFDNMGGGDSLLDLSKEIFPLKMTNAQGVSFNAGGVWLYEMSAFDSSKARRNIEILNQV